MTDNATDGNQLSGRVTARCTPEQEAKLRALADLLPSYRNLSDFVRERLIEPACDEYDEIVEKVGSRHAA